MLEYWLVGARLAQYACLLLLCGLPCFVLRAFTEAQARELFWRRLLLSLSAAAWLSMLLWLVAQSALLQDHPSDALHWQALASIIDSTRFGLLQAIRIGWLTLVGLALLLTPATARIWPLAALSGAVLLGSLAWSGHGHIDHGVIGGLHLAADVAHLLAAAIWAGALVGLCLLLRRASADDWQKLQALERFSSIGTAVVATLIVSGMINSLLLVGAGHWQQLSASAWARTLLWKLLLFVLMLMLAANNRYWLSPRLRAGADGRAWAAIRRSVLLETVLGVAVVAAVALLGTLPPPVSD